MDYQGGDSDIPSTRETTWEITEGEANVLNFRHATTSADHWNCSLTLLAKFILNWLNKAINMSSKLLNMP